MQMAVDDLPPSKSQRHLVVAAAMLGYHNRTSIHYTQDLKLRMHGVTQHIRPPQVPDLRRLLVVRDLVLQRRGRAPTRTASSTTGAATPGRCSRSGVHTATAAPADLVFYGGTNAVPAHVVIAVGDGLVVSHGSEIGPSLVAQGYRNDQIGIRSYLPR